MTYLNKPCPLGGTTFLPLSSPASFFVYVLNVLLHSFMNYTWLSFCASPDLSVSVSATDFHNGGVVSISNGASGGGVNFKAYGK